MKLIFDYRVLTHKNYTGVENYAKNIFENIVETRLAIKSTTTEEINIAKPKTANKYLAHLWTHFILPFQRGHVLFCPANIAPIYVPKNKKLIITIHDVAFLSYSKTFSKFFKFYYKFIIPINIKRANKIITVSNSSKKEIEKYYPYSNGKIEVIYLGSSKKFKCLGLKKKKQILYVGSMNERKNFIGILLAFNNLNLSDITLVMVGNYSTNFDLTNEAQEILNEAKLNPYIVFKSAIDNDELVKLYNESQLFVFPSFYEGFGLPVLEAMACGTPVICSSITSLPEVGGDAVVYCDPYNIDNIKEKIELVLGDENLQKEMSIKGLQRAKEFSWEKAAKEHLKVFNEVLKS